MIRGIHHISMKCGDPAQFEAAVCFYRDALGLKVVREWDEGAFLDTGAGMIEIFRNGPGERRKGAIRHVALATDDLDACAQRVRQAGCHFFIEPKPLLIPSDPPLRARVAFCTGPLGEEIELFEESKP